MIATTDPISSTRAAALFLSDVSAADQPAAAGVETAIREALRSRGGPRGCAADVAAAFGDYPELAVPRMRWACAVVASLHSRPDTGPATVPQREARPAVARRSLAVAA
jgi:hypothetical protein